MNAHQRRLYTPAHTHYRPDDAHRPEAWRDIPALARQRRRAVLAFRLILAASLLCLGTAAIVAVSRL